MGYSELPRMSIFFKIDLSLTLFDKFFFLKKLEDSNLNVNSTASILYSC